MDNTQAQAHFIEAATGKMIARRLIAIVPRVGEECRFKDGEYWKVTAVIHCYDEEAPFHRANIGLEKVKP